MTEQTTCDYCEQPAIVFAQFVSSFHVADLCQKHQRMVVK